MKKIHDSLVFCADQIDVIMNFAGCYNECRYKEGSLYLVMSSLKFALRLMYCLYMQINF